MASGTSSCVDSNEIRDDFECAVCLQPCIHPAKLPCGHIFCFLCVKGIANQSKKCAMCRQEIPRDFIENPTLLSHSEPTDKPEENYTWYYEGRNGWWQYDERTCKELETAYKSGDKTSELLIAGFLYIIDFENMLQLRRNDLSRRRNIKRDLSNIPKKGVAGLRVHKNHVEDSVDVVSQVPVTSSNTTCQLPENTRRLRSSTEEEEEVLTESMQKIQITHRKT